ncbi:Pyruvate decarboxylase isozyme 3 [Fusarium oxysporum f. sp. narcissi]|uniref:Pyruvate decarboxylase n=1 Tax=Fusarium oxysporum f. sp. narcissi TaxID=451672 RepID=A0A4Q2WEX1_FUSOX|nr:Pyruvate decarboxylase 1 [Fusarium oxysporum]KAJ4267816.1 Pyruvate decarboxylase 1 [Fusarium oxysporum]RKL49981.1 Pyruvate decarboxylase isozyme 3 [Fusarium oxysporum]RYC96988.1 Pyruvate decarboxylase isozyme 3 [Fusarium oxysporum f. sp. narcissi]
MTKSQIPIGEYLFRRIASLGIRHIFGVPGDFNLTILDHVYAVPELEWLGCCNELNAAYATDGYARIRELPGVLLTTYGVGELSAMNGVAGAYAEHAGMIHIVGMTSRKVNEEKLTADIDRAIEDCVKSRLPVYIFIPMDVPSIPVPLSALDKPLNLEIKNDGEIESKILSKILDAVSCAKNPSILADVLTIRHGGRDLVRELADLTQFPTFSCPLSKGIIDEDKPYYMGVYSANVSFPGVQEALEASDLIINTGTLQTDSNTGGFTRKIPEEKVILLEHNKCVVLGEEFPNIHFLPVLRRLVKNLKAKATQYNLPVALPAARINPPQLRSDRSGQLIQDFVWQRIGKFLQPDDIIVTDCGTGQFGMFDATFPPASRAITSTFWSAIGFSVGACLGACVAAREMKHSGRVILIVGDGSLQISVQDIGTCIRFGFKPIIFVVNNNGYSIERTIRGAELSYNDINSNWDHQQLLGFFGARPDTGIASFSTECHTVEELESVLSKDELKRAEHISLIELFFSPFDYPWRLATQVSNTLGRPLEKQDKFD